MRPLNRIWKNQAVTGCAKLKTIKCECGHSNPFGTEICESCGKPLTNENSRELINMRYEGSAVRSQTYNKTIVDKIWNFFSSVKVGIWIIIVILIVIADWDHLSARNVHTT